MRNEKEQRNALEYNWETFFADAKQLAELVKSEEFQSLLVVTRGGLFLGGLLSEYLDIKIVETIGIISYFNGGKMESTLHKTADLSLPKPLVVDDIADSGDTLQLIKGMRDLPVATLFYKPQSLVRPDYYLYETDQWVKFPWEVQSLREGVK